MANVATFLDGISVQTAEGTQYMFLNSITAFAITQELHYRIDKIQKVGMTPGANTYFARCSHDSYMVTNVPRAVVDSVVRHFLRISKFLEEQIKSMEEMELPRFSVSEEYTQE